MPGVLPGRCPAARGVTIARSTGWTEAMAMAGLPGPQLSHL